MAEKRFIFSTERIEELKTLVDDGYKLTRDEKFWFSNFPLVKRAGLTFSFTDEEINEYTKCKLGVDQFGNPFRNLDGQILSQSGVQYFAEKYCKIKNELGQINNIRLREYQKEIMDMYMNNRFSVLLASRQTGKCCQVGTKINADYSEIEIEKLWYENKTNKTILEKIKIFLYKILSSKYMINK